MDILNDKTIISPILKPDIEQVEKKKHEYYLLGTFRITKGLRLFGYDPLKNELFEVFIKNGETVHLDTQDNKLIVTDKESKSIMIDSRFQYFEALNIKTAKKRLGKYLNGKITELFNLKKPSEKNIKLF